MSDEIDYLDQRHRLEPGGLQHRLVTLCPVHHVEDHVPPFFVVSPHDAVTALLRDVATWPSGQGPGVEYTAGGVLGSADRPDHTRQRRVLAQRFTPQVMAALRPRVERLADELFAAMVESDHGDFVANYAAPLPAIVIAELLGVAPEDRDQFRAWSDDIVAGLGGEDLERQERTRVEMMAFFYACLDTRTAALSAAGGVLDESALGSVVPDDLLSCMALAAHAEGSLTRREMAQLALQILVAGHETTTSLLGLMVYRVTERPALLRRLREQPQWRDAFIEETLRFDAPVQGLFRTAARDVEVRGTLIPAGSKVETLFAAANRDPVRFADPDEFRIDRDAAELGEHLAFGYGIHKCIGAPLARMEARVSLDRLVDNLDEIVLDGTPEVIRPFILRGFSRLPIRWSSRTS